MELLDFSRTFNTPLLVLIISAYISCSEIPRPRGVSLSRAPLYPPDKDFVCFDGSITIPFSQVNDDYCDCPDASDEPGTSACPHGIFYCTNAGHKPLNIASSRVNDGVCDCCDASDEYALSTVKCLNTCNELGRSAREEAQRRAKLIKAGKQVRAELIQQGIQLKQEKKEKLIELEKNKIEAEKVKFEKEEIKKHMEELENVALQKYREIEEEEKRKAEEIEAAKNKEEALTNFDKLDTNKDGKIEILELKAIQAFDKDRDGEVSEIEAQFFLNEQEFVDLEEFLANTWPRMKPFLMAHEGIFKSPVQEDTGEEETDDTGEAGDLESEDSEHDGEDEEDVPEEKAEEAPEPLKYDEETQKLIDQANAARNEFNEADKDVLNIVLEIKKIEEYLGKDFGPDEEFATLEGQCFEYSDYEYIYILCPFDKAVQKPKSSSLETRLGLWGKWSGPDRNKYSSMLYDRGQACWNGPQRTTQVRINCGSENKVTAVSEPNRCEYLFDFVTPAVCNESQADQNEDVHDEL